MQAAVYEKYGPPEVVSVKQVEKPAPGEDEVLVKVYATTIRAGDVRMRSFNVPPGEWLFARLYLGVFSPRRKILGMELAGEVEQVGRRVQKFKIGDQVFATTELEFGAHAQYKCLQEHRILASKPTNVTYEQAAVVPTGALGALAMIRDKAGVQEGQKVLVYGASGSVGSYAVQLARYYGAQVSGVCSTSKVEKVKSLGVETVFDYTKEDFTANGIKYDCILDAAGVLSKSESQQSLAPGGKFVSIHKDSYKESGADLEFISQLIEAGSITPLVDRVYPLENIVDAYRYFEQGKKMGGVVISVPQEE
jgi:NADPH:quinone reductase-like Zn-dependent oxidoreductase